MTDTAVRSDGASTSHPAHPLDPATAAEYLAGRDIGQKPPPLTRKGRPPPDPV
jgi:hypothetical protein